MQGGEPVQAGGFHGLLGKFVRQEPQGLVRKTGHGRTVRFDADGVNDGVRAPSVRRLPQLAGQVLAVVQGLHPVPCCHPAPLGDGVHTDHAQALVHADPGGELGWVVSHCDCRPCRHI